MGCVAAPATAASLHETNPIAEPVSPTSPAAIRQRIALVCETFSRDTEPFPEPMSQGEREAAVSMTPAEIDNLAPDIEFASSWGVRTAAALDQAYCF